MYPPVTTLYKNAGCGAAEKVAAGQVKLIFTSTFPAESKVIAVQVALLEPGVTAPKSPAEETEIPVAGVRGGTT